jgi:hypothetical protein
VIIPLVSGESAPLAGRSQKHRYQTVVISQLIASKPRNNSAVRARYQVSEGARKSA